MKKVLLLLTFLISVYSIGYAQCIPNVTINSTPSGPVCSDMVVTFTAIPGNGGTPSYKWTSSVRGILPSTASTFTSMSLSNGEVISVEMTSSLGCASPTTAMSSVTMSVYPTATPVVSIIADKNVICMGEAVTLTATPANGGSAPTYQWSKNGVPIPSATNSTYTTTGSVNGDSYNVQMTSSLACTLPFPIASNAIVITVIPTLTISVSITSNVPGTCMGNPVEFTAVVPSLGSIPAPTYEWFITSASTPTAGVSQGVPSPTATTFATSALTLPYNKVYVQVVSTAPCASSTPVASNVVAITTNIGIGSGTIGPDQTICYNTIPAAITQTTVPTNIVGTPTYMWEACPSLIGPFTPIVGATNVTFTPTVPITQDVYIRRVTTDPGAPAPCNVATSNVVHITVRPQLVPGVIGSDETVCSGAPTTTITETNATTGGTGTYTYQWQSSFSGTFANIPGATNSSYNPGPLTTTKQFRLVTSSICGSGGISNVVTKTIVAPGIVTASINDPGQICEASPPITFIATVAATGPGTLSYSWSLGGVTVATNSPTYAYTPFVGDNGKTVSVRVTTSTGCNTGPATSNVTLNIVGAITPTVSISGNPVNCAGLQTTFTATSTGGGSTPTYQWYVRPQGSGPPVAVGTGGTTFTSTSLSNGDRVYVELTSSLACLIGVNPFISNEITMAIKPIPAPAIIEGDQTICAPNTFTFHGIVTAGNVYEWRQLPANRVVSTGSDYITTQSGSYYIYEDNGTCSVASALVTLTVDPCGAFSTTISGPNPITAGQQNAVYSVFNQTGFTYTWSITGGTIVSGQNTNSVTVDWDAPTSSAFARTTATSYSISVLEKNTTNQTKTTTATINTVATGTTLSQAQSGINVFPNPTTGTFNIEMPESGVAVAYEILDVTGLSVASGTFTSTGNDQQINADFGAGMYQVVLKYNNVVTCVRLSKVQ